MWWHRGIPVERLYLACSVPQEFGKGVADCCIMVWLCNVHPYLSELIYCNWRKNTTVPVPVKRTWWTSVLHWLKSAKQTRKQSPAMCILWGIYFNYLTHRGQDQMTDMFQRTFSCAFLQWKYLNFERIWLRFVHNGPIDNNTVLVQKMAWRRTGDKHICVTQPQRVKFVCNGPARHKPFYSATESWLVLHGANFLWPVIMADTRLVLRGIPPFYPR